MKLHICLDFTESEATDEAGQAKVASMMLDTLANRLLKRRSLAHEAHRFAGVAMRVTPEHDDEDSSAD